jgi:hypothetical protein
MKIYIGGSANLNVKLLFVTYVSISAIVPSSVEACYTPW